MGPARSLTFVAGARATWRRPGPQVRGEQARQQVGDSVGGSSGPCLGWWVGSSGAQGTASLMSSDWDSVAEPGGPFLGGGQCLPPRCSGSGPSLSVQVRGEALL